MSDSDSETENTFLEITKQSIKHQVKQENVENNSEYEIETSKIISKKVSHTKKAKQQFEKRKMELKKMHEEREAELSERVFGDKEKLLHNLQITAECSLKKKQKTLSKPQQPAWNDSDDDGYDNVTTNGNEKIMQKEKYKKQLENKFKRILGTPLWAELDRKYIDDDDSDDEILRTVGHLSKNRSTKLTKGHLEFKRLKDLNRDSYAEGPLITGVEFHPTSTACIVAGTRGIATVFAIDGKQNNKLHSMEFSNFPIRCMRLTHDGNEAIFGGSQKYFYSYDLISGKTQRIFLPKIITKLREFELSPCGKFIAVIGRFGEVHLLSGTTKELICTLKQEHLVVSVAFSRDSKFIFTHSVDSEIVVYDIGEERQIHRFQDDGCINGTNVTISADQHLIAASSAQGVVNIYNYSEAMAQKLPQPIKTMMNLTTGISSIQFNHSSEMLAFASKEIQDAVKLAHFPSGTVFHNFPGNEPKLGKPNVIRFSPQSGFMAIAGHQDKVFLYRLKHFNNY